MPTLLTAANGTLGSTLAPLLTGSGHPVIRASRTPAPASAGTVRLDYDDPATFPAALRGVTTLFLIAPFLGPSSDRRLAAFLDAAGAAGVQHVVVNSAQLAALSEEFVLRRLERRVEAAVPRWTHLRSHWYMSSITRGIFTPRLRAGEFALPVGPGDRIPYVAVEDVARVAARILLDPAPHAGRVYELTGPEALDGPQVAAACARAWARPVVFRSLGEAAYADGCRAAGLDEGAVGMLLELFAAVRDGCGARTTDTVRQLTGRHPRTLSQVLAPSEAAVTANP